MIVVMTVVLILMVTNDDNSGDSYGSVDGDCYL